MCFKKNEPVRLAKKEPGLLDNILFILSIPEVWIIIAIVLIFIISVWICMNNAPYYYNYRV